MEVARVHEEHIQIATCSELGSDSSSQCDFEGEAGAANIQTLLQFCNALATAFMTCSVITFCSSEYTGPDSALDAILVMADVICIDISSALFVSAGFTATSVYLATAAVKFDALVHTTALSMVVDMYIATAASLLLGSLHALLMHNFKWRDVGFTLVEGVTTLRGLDFQQSPAAPHSYNVVTWPVQSLLWCILSTKAVYKFDELIVARFPALADAIIGLMALIGIVLFTAFGPMQASSNIFYANACSVTYRSMEFNLGVHLIFMHHRHPMMMAVVRRLVQKSFHLILLFFVTIWWSEIGRPVTPATPGTCLRLYYRNSCLQDHHAFFLRGCLLAFLFLMSSDIETPSDVSREMRVAQTNLSAIVFCWPVCIAVKLVLDVTFGTAVIAANRAVVSVLCMSILFGLSFFYNTLVKPPLLKTLAERFIPPAPAPSSPDTPAL